MTLVQILYSGLGGHSSVGFSLVEADTEKKYTHVIIFYGIEEMPEAYITKCKQLDIEFFFVSKKTGADFGSMKKIVALLKQIQPGAVLLHSVSLIVPLYCFSLLNTTKIIAVEHQPNHLKTKMEWVWSYLLMLLAKKVVYLTDLYDTQMKKKLGFFYSPGKVKIINNGINTSLFKPSAKKDPAETIKIGMLARLMATKDHLSLIKAVNILIQNNSTAATELYIAGDGEMKATLVAETEKMGLNNSVHFCGMITETASVDFINSINIYVHASLGETMSTSIMQVMACGKPIIASDVNGINNMLKNNVTALLVPPQNAAALANALLQLLNNPQKAAELGHNAFTFATTHYSSKTMFDKYSSLF